MSLIEHLKQIPDFRTQPRCPLWVILLLVIMGTMSGCSGYRALEDFVVRHQGVLIELLELPYKRLPCFSTLRRSMVRVDFEALTVAFNAWSTETFAGIIDDQIATDGKSIKAETTVTKSCWALSPSSLLLEPIRKMLGAYDRQSNKRQSGQNLSKSEIT